MHPIPKIHPAREIDIIGYETIMLDSGIPCFGFNGVPYDIINIDFCFDSGRWTETKPLTASFYSKMFKTGTEKANAEQLSENIDFWGGTIKINQGYNSITISVYSILRNLEPVLQILQEIFLESKFEQDKLDFKKEKSINRLNINNRKTEFLADEAFKKMIFGENHPYGYTTKKEDIENINRNDVVDYFKNNICSNNLKVYVSGKYDNAVIKMIDKYFPLSVFSNPVDTAFKYQSQPAANKKFHLTIPQAEQASLIIGKELEVPRDATFYDFSVLNTILGGYFGSRLMKNIREDKGYTYGIHSEIMNYKHSSVWCISTEVGLEYIELCKEEIYKEILRLKNEKIDNQELDRVRNYLMGKMLRYFDGPFNTKNVYKTFWNTNREIEHLTYLINSIKTVTSKRLLELANSFFNEESFYEVLVD